MHPFSFPIRALLRGAVVALLLSSGVLPVGAQQGRRLPRIGYLFPAGIQRGTTCEITAGGQFLEGVTEAFVSGSGVTVSLLRYDKPLPQKRQGEFRDYIQDARKKATEGQPPPPFSNEKFNRPSNIAEILKEAGASEDEIRDFLKIRKQQADTKRQQNLQISETAVFKVEAAANAAPGPREIRLLTPLGLTNPLTFCVGTLPETTKNSLADKPLDGPPRIPLSSVFNGQILPGEVDRITFQARRGARIVAAVQARDLVPYLADAVPGWFQPVAVLTDAQGHEVAYANAFRFSPDPVLSCEIPADGLYQIEIRDALYRGREDFIYRLTLGEIPFVTGIFPLGGRAGVATVVDVTGWNIARNRAILPPQPEEGIHRLSDLSNGFVIGDTAFDASTLPEIEEKEPNNTVQTAQPIPLPVMINGRIGTPGDEDVFAISCTAGERLVAEVTARRLNSPLDSWLKITDATGLQLAFNDDQEDKGASLITHQADSLLSFTAPADGTYYLHLGDAQKKGGPEYAYRLRVSAPRPDFALRWVPSSLNAPRPGVTLPFTVYALRKDGFDGPIALAFKDPPPGFVLQGGTIEAGQETVRVNVTFPPAPTVHPIPLVVEGNATVNGHEIRHPAVPADDMLQAFAYHHLVPAQALLAVVSTPPPPKPQGLAVLVPPVFSLQSLPPDVRGNPLAQGFLARPPSLPGGQPPQKNGTPLGLLPAVPLQLASPLPVRRD